LDAVARLTIRDLDDDTMRRIRVRAELNKRSVEDEARVILRTAVAQDGVPSDNLVEMFARRFRPFGDVVLKIPKRRRGRPPPTFR
jgi:antitoxin FitA